MANAVAFSSRTPITNKGDFASRELEGVIQALLNRTGGSVGGLSASEVSFSATGGLSSNTVQQALAELDAEKANSADLTAHISDATDAHAASAITNTPAGNIAATTVQAAINELDTEKLPASAVGTIASQNANSVNITGGTIALASGSLGYATGNGGTVAQAVSKANGVTLNKISGEITLQSTAMAADTSIFFTLTNNTIAAGDVLILNHVSGGTFMGYTLGAQASAGAAVIGVRNVTTGALGEAIVIRFAVIKAANS